MDTGLKHTHTLVVILYGLLLFTKFILVLLKKKNVFEKVTQKTKIPRIVIDSLLLLTGVVLLIKAPAGLSTANLIKYAAVVASIGFTVIGSKRFSVASMSLAVIFFVYAYEVSKTLSPFLQNDEVRIEKMLATGTFSSQTPNLERGHMIFQEACMRCHGTAGDAGFYKAANLQTSTQDDTYKAAIIKNGKGTMPASIYLNNEQVQDVVAYISTLKK